MVDAPDAAPVIRVVIADDHSLVRESVATILSLSDGIEVIGTASTGTDAVTLIESTDPDVALLDIDMPGLDGLEVAAHLHLTGRECAVVIVTGFGRPGYLHRAMQADVRGFLTKDAPAATLVEVVRTVAAGGRHIDPDVATEAITLGNNPLSKRELEVLGRSAEGHTVAEIADTLCLTEGTTRNYLSSAISKLGVNNKIAAIRVASESGWL